MIYENVLKAIGNTPIVKLNRVTADSVANVFVKLEFMNPGGSIKDRIGWTLIEDAERRGVLKPGGTIIEGTSGNTGVGLAIAAAIKGYKCVFVLPDKMSMEKIKNLRAFGARVIVTPTAVEPEDPRSYYSVSRRLATEIPNSIYIDQYNNLANRETHYQYTAPEILQQFPDVDVIVAGIGTGGTICGIGQYFKKHKPSVKMIAVDPVGSIVYEYYKTGVAKTAPKTYKIEGIGEDFIPGNYDLTVVDDMVQVEDRESFLMTRNLLTKEGLYVGISCGSAVVGALRWIKSQGESMKNKNVLVILPDSGNRYLSKVYDDDWMREAGFLDTPSLGTVDDMLRASNRQASQLVMVKQTQRIKPVIDLMKDKGISQVPVQDDAGWIKGIVTETGILNSLFQGKVTPDDTIDRLMDASIEFVTLSDPVEKLMRLVTSGKTPLVADPKNSGAILAIVTKIDLLEFLGQKQ